MKKTDTAPAFPGVMLKRAKDMAASKATSVVAILKHLLESQPGYEKAHRRQSPFLTKGLDLRTMGKRRWSREDLHSRFPEIQEREVVGRYDRLVDRMASRNESFSEQDVEADVRKARQNPKSR